MDKTPIGRFERTLIASALAMLLVVVLSFLLASFEALAQPMKETAAVNLYLEKAGPSIAEPGDSLTYTINIQREGADAPSTWFTDELPAELNYVSNSLTATDDLGDEYGTFGVENNVITWSVPSLKGSSVWITFSAQISSQFEGEVVNTAKLTGAGELITDAWKTNIVTGRMYSQIRSPNKNAYITEKDSRTISGIAWKEGTEPPYLVEDISLTVERTTKNTYKLQWSPVHSSADYVVEEATEPQFSDPTPIYFGSATEYAHIQNTDGTYYYRVKADPDTEIEDSRWSNVISVTVPWESTTAASNVSTLAAADASAGDSITVQVRVSETGLVENADWSTAVVTPTGEWGAEWSYEWDPMPQARNTQYVIQTRAYGEDGPQSETPIDAITVTLDNKDYTVFFPLIFKRYPPIPYPPELTLTGKEDERDDTYTLSWTYSDDSPEVQDPDDYAGDSYTLEEATKSDFSDATPIYQGNAKSYEVIEQESGTYYYRVRGHNDAGAGEWSNVKTVTVESFSYFDDFSDYKSGWPREWSETRGALYRVRPNEHPACPGCKYEGAETYVIARRVGTQKPRARFGPEVKVPVADYEINVKARWFETTRRAVYEVFFGSDKSFDNFYALRVQQIDGECSYALVEDGDKNFITSWKKNSYIKCGRGDDGDWDNWRIRRQGNSITIWVNNHKLGSWSDSSYGANRYFGVGCTTFEGWTPSKPEFDNFTVEELD